MDGQQPRPTRPERENRTEAVRIRCTPAELAEIEARAEDAGLSLSEFVRASARTVTIRGNVDQRAIDALATATGNLNRVGGLLKLWLSDRRGDGAPAVAVDAVLADIKTAVAAIHQKAEAL